MGLVVLLMALALYLALWWRLSVAIDQTLDGATPLAEIRRGTSFVALDGRFGVESLDIVPRLEGLRVAPIRTGRVTVSAPGLLWLARYALGGTAALPDALSIEVDRPGFASEPPPSATPMPIGLSSASPFESFGCGDPGFSLTDIAGLGIPNAAPRIVATLARETEARLALQLVAGSNDVGTTTLTAYFALPPGANPLQQPGAATLVSARVDVSDDGFVRARNRHCASRAGISQFEFIARHVSAVKAWVQGFELIPASSVEASYRRFATRGRELTVELRPARPATLAALWQLPARQRWDAMVATIKTTGEPTSELRWDAPYPQQAMPLDIGPPELSLAPAAAPGAAPAAATPAVASPVIEAPPPTTPAAVAPASAPASASSPAAVPATALATSPPPPPLPPPLAAAVPPPPAQAPVAGAATSAPAYPMPAPEPMPLVFDDLGSQVGRIVTVRSIYGTTRSGVLTRFTRAGITIRVSITEGGFELSMPSRTIRTVSIGDASVRGPGYR